MAVEVEHEHPSLPGWQFTTTAEAGVSLADGSRWWGTRVRFRKAPARRWESVVLMDVHPFDTDTIARALGLVVTRRAA